MLNGGGRRERRREKRGGRGRGGKERGKKKREEKKGKEGEEGTQKGKEQETLIDATQGRRTKSVIFTENDKIILSALQPETLAGRFNGNAVEVDDDAKEVKVDGEVVKLTPIEYQILLLLMKNPGRVFSTQQIYESIWNEDAYGVENTVAVHIRHIREKIEINPKEPRYLKVVWGVGYKMEK